MAARALLESCLFVLGEVLTKLGVEVTFVTGTDLAAWQDEACDAKKVFFLKRFQTPR